MNPSNPTTEELHNIEQLFFEQMRMQTRKATDPILAARLRSFEFQFSDRWIQTA
jgi:hypothetical protein